MWNDEQHQEKLFKLSQSVDLFYQGHSPNQIAKILHTDPQSVRNHLRQYGYTDMNIDNGLHVDIFKDIDTANKAYWLGFLFADGYIRENSVELALKDKEHIEKFKTFINSRCKISERHIYLKTTQKEYIAYRLNLRNKEFASYLYKTGLHQAKSLDIIYPECVPETLTYDFVRGYFDGNGCISFLGNNPLKPVITINSTYEFLSTIINKMGLPNNKIRQVSKIYEYRVAKFTAIIDFLNKIYSNAETYLERKYDKYQMICRASSN